MLHCLYEAEYHACFCAVKFLISKKPKKPNFPLQINMSGQMKIRQEGFSAMKVSLICLNLIVTVYQIVDIRYLSHSGVMDSGLD